MILTCEVNNVVFLEDCHLKRCSFVRSYFRLYFVRSFVLSFAHPLALMDRLSPDVHRILQLTKFKLGGQCFVSISWTNYSISEIVITLIKKKIVLRKPGNRAAMTSETTTQREINV